MIIFELGQPITLVETTIYAFIGLNMFLASSCLLYKGVHKIKAHRSA